MLFWPSRGPKTAVKIKDEEVSRGTMTVKKLLIVAPVLLALAFASLAMADNVQTLPEYNGTGSYTDPGPYQPPTVVGTFDILAGDTAATISGQFGNSTVGSSAGVDLYLGSILVAQCVEFAACYNGDVAWSDTLTAGQIASLGTGLVDFTAVQTSQYTIRLGVTTLDQATAAPEPATLGLLGMGLLGLSTLGLRRKQDLA